VVFSEKPGSWQAAAIRTPYCEGLYLATWKEGMENTTRDLEASGPMAPPAPQFP